MPTSLVIVESPAKCKKIESYLGPGYKCIASYGHLRELKSLDAIHRDNQYDVTFEIAADERKQKHIEYMRKDILGAAEVILATDDDREGEAIAWHICMIFDLPPSTTKRIVFHEITENAIQSAIAHPRFLNMDIVHAQQARQVLDLVVGFKVSPMLWKHIASKTPNSLSAGRCQTPALRIIYDNQKDIDESPGTKVYNTVGYFSNKCIPFELNKTFEKENDVTKFLQDSIRFSHSFSRTEPKKVYREPPEPLTTSKIQQIASNEMRISPKETMKACQTLYEAGYITYMRTDSKKYSPEFIGECKSYIVKIYGDSKYISANIDSLMVGSNEDTKKVASKKTKKMDKKANIPPPQEAHEAIRPTNILCKDIPEEMTTREKKLYRLIWENALESCMSAAEFYTFIASITSSIPDTTYSSTMELIDFPGWKIVKQKFSTVNKEYSYLQQIKPGIIMPYKKITSKVTLKGTKQHYTEAKLVQLLEEKGIGRPSTFSMLVDKIQERGYVVKQDIIGKKMVCKDFSLEDSVIKEESGEREFGNEKSKLVIQPVGTMVIQFLINHFDSLFNYNYTKEMEDDLDKISKGNMALWYSLCEKCWQDTDTICSSLKTDKKQEIRIDDNHIFMIAKYGPVIKCTEDNKTSFKSVKKDIDLGKLERGEYTLDDVVEDKKNSGATSIGEYQGYPLFVKKGKFGRYVTWNTNTKSLAAFGNRPIENISLEDIITEIEKNGVPVDGEKPESSIVRTVNDNISIRKGQYGDYIFYKTKKMKQPKFLKLDGCKENYKICNIILLKNWLLEKHGIQ
jgi:DNA topoisomerase-1